MKYTPEKIEAIAEKLREMPPIEKKREHSKQEAVKILSKEIANLQKRGYTLNQISETLCGEGLDISTPTLKNYLQRKKKVKSDDSSKEKTKDNPTIKKQSEEKKSTFVPKPDTDDI